MYRATVFYIYLYRGQSQKRDQGVAQIQKLILNLDSA
jgi:hypothetical protein